MRVGYSNTAVEYQIESGYVSTSYVPYNVIAYANVKKDNKKDLKWIFGTIDTSTGSLVDSTTKIVTDGIVTFNSGDKFELDAKQVNAIACFYNEDGTYTNKYLQMNSVGNKVIEFTETTYAKIRLGYNSNITILNFNNLLAYCSFTINQNLTNKWNGKRALIFGMSITFGYQLFDSNWT